MLRSFLALAAIICAVAPSSAIARPVADVAGLATIGCFDKADLVDILAAGRTTKGEDARLQMMKRDALLLDKISSLRCFKIERGQMAVSDQDWQVMADQYRGIVALSSKSGRRFYSNSNGWQYAGQITSFIDP